METDYQNVVGQDDLTRFDKKKNKNNNAGNRGNRHHDRRNNSHRNHEKGSTARPE